MEINSGRPSDRQSEIEIHQRLLANDPLASSDLAEMCLEVLEKYLTRKYPQSDQHQIYDAVTKAYFNYVEQPASYDLSKKGLMSFLKMAAERDLQNLLATQKRRTLRMVSLDRVELRDVAGNTNIEEEFISRTENIARLKEVKAARLKQIDLVADNSVDQEIMSLMQADTRDTRIFAQLLQITHLPLKEQRRIVK